jgi:DUF971 family protein
MVVGGMPGSDVSGAGSGYCRLFVFPFRPTNRVGGKTCAAGAAGPTEGGFPIMRAMDEELPKLVSIRRDGDGLVIEWADGLRKRLAFAVLRKSCPCASCNEERAKPADPFKVLSAKEVETIGNLQIAAMPRRGLYAYQIAWNDGHDTGIYSLKFLRELCERTD